MVKDNHISRGKFTIEKTIFPPLLLTFSRAFYLFFGLFGWTLQGFGVTPPYNQLLRTCSVFFESTVMDWN